MSARGSFCPIIKSECLKGQCRFWDIYKKKCTLIHLVDLFEEINRHLKCLREKLLEEECPDKD